MNSKKVMVIDCGIGNVGSVAHALDFLGGEYLVSGNRSDLQKSDAFILPGVSSFASAMYNLNNLHLIDELREQILSKKKPFFGICVGMQVLAVDSMEGGFHEGLGWIEGHVIPLRNEGNLRVPHVGWNNVTIDHSSYFFQRVDEGAHFYFDHSFHFKCDENIAVATIEYGCTYLAALQRENIFATQFHPEKSQRNGLKVLRNFLNFIEMQE